MKENKQNVPAQQAPAGKTPPATQSPSRSYNAHAIVFLAAVLLVTALGWMLPSALNMRESIVERYLMGGFAVFLAGFLFWLK